MLESLKSTMSRPNVIQMSELALQFCGKSDAAPHPATDSHLPVMIFHCPEDFSTVEYFEVLQDRVVGKRHIELNDSFYVYSFSCRT